MKSLPRRCPPILLLAALFVATGCSEQPVRPGVGTTPPPSTSAPPEPAQPITVDEVERLLALAARSNDPMTANEARLDALAELLRRGESMRARELLDALIPTHLDPRQRVRHALLGARLDLEEHKPHEALLRLQQLAPVENAIGATLQVELALVRADVLSALDRHLDSAHERTLIHPWLRDEAKRHDNATALFAALAATDMASLEHAINDATREDWRGWLELAALVRDVRRGPHAQLAGLARWEQRYAPLAPLRSAADMLPEIRVRIHQPARVALLLPLSGEAAVAGLAVLHGYLAQYMQQAAAGEALPSVAVMDTAATPGGFAAAYATAIADGAEFVIGPLLKEDLNAFGPTLPASVPTLALNFLDTPSSSDERLYTFGLDATDEAEQLVRTARMRGFHRAAVLSDDSQLSRRQAEWFRERWRTITTDDIIDTLVLGDLNVFRQELERMLLIQGSKQRTSTLTRLLGRELVSEIRRRQDLELLVMFANPVAARSLRPLVSFLYADDLPLWATSQIYAAQPDRRGDRDLEAVRFLDAPWFSAPELPLREALGEDAAPGGMQRFAALGVDACRLQSRIGLLEWANTPGLVGATGKLVLDAGRRLHRRLSWYAFNAGIAVAEDPYPALAGPARTDSLSTEGEAQWNAGDHAGQPVPQP